MLNMVAWWYVSRVGNPKLMNNIMADIVISVPYSFKGQNGSSKVLTKFDILITHYQREPIINIQWKISND